MPPMPSGHIAPALLERKTPDRSISQIVGPNGLPITTYEPTVDNILQTPPGFDNFYLGTGILGTSSPAVDATPEGSWQAGDRLLSIGPSNGSPPATWFVEYYKPLANCALWAKIADGDATDIIPANRCAGGLQIHTFRDNLNYKWPNFLHTDNQRYAYTGTDIIHDALPLTSSEINNPGKYGRFYVYSFTSSYVSPSTYDPPYSISNLRDTGTAVQIYGFTEAITGGASSEFTVPYSPTVNDVKSTVTYAKMIEIL